MTRGRGGIRFSSLSENSQKILKEWLFDNLLIACSNREARTEQIARHGENEPRSERGNDNDNNNNARAVAVA